MTTTNSKPGDFMKDPTFLATMGHIGWGAVVMLIAAALAPVSKHPWLVLGIVQLVLVAGIAFKEYVIDLREESNETVASSTVDFFGWMGGSSLAWAVVGLEITLRVWP